MILAFFISSAVYQHIDPYRTWRSGRMWAYARDTIFGWGVTIAVLWFLGSASGLKYFYDERVLLAWFDRHAGDPAHQPHRGAPAGLPAAARRCARWWWSAPTTSA
jgi:hypothetical protein